MCPKFTFAKKHSASHDIMQADSLCTYRMSLDIIIAHCYNFIVVCSNASRWAAPSNHLQGRWSVGIL